jgi:molybdopterin-binding protein
MKLAVSVKNQLKGKIVDVTKGGHRARVRIEIGQGAVITASITNEAAAELGLQKGDEAWAIIRASDVMIGK